MLQGSAEMKKMKQLKDGTVEIKKIFLATQIVTKAKKY